MLSQIPPKISILIFYGLFPVRRLKVHALKHKTTTTSERRAHMRSRRDKEQQTRSKYLLRQILTHTSFFCMSFSRGSNNPFLSRMGHVLQSPTVHLHFSSSLVLSHTYSFHSCLRRDFRFVREKFP